MNLRTRSLLLLAAVLWLMGIGFARGGWPCKLCGKNQAECEPCEQPQHVCEQVCEKKAIKKTVYKIKCIPYCRHNCPCSCCKEGCSSCDPCVYYRKVLLKKSVKAGEETIVRCAVQAVCPECGGMRSTDHAPGSMSPGKVSADKPLPAHESAVPDAPPKPSREIPAKSAAVETPANDTGAPAPPPEDAP